MKNYLIIYVVLFILTACSDFNAKEISCKNKPDNCPNGYYCSFNSVCKSKDELCAINNFKTQNCLDNSYCDVIAKTDETGKDIGYDPICECETGYYKLTNAENENITKCEKGLNPCELDVCQDGKCIAKENQDYICECNHGYENGTNNDKICISMCEHISCDWKGVCVIETVNDISEARCECDPGFLLSKDNKNCINTCENVSCGFAGNCEINELLGEPFCSCSDKYQDYDNNLICNESCDFVAEKNIAQPNAYICDDSSGEIIYSCNEGYQDNDNNYSCLTSCSNHAHILCDDSSGEINWNFIAFSYSSLYSDEAISIKTDKAGNIYSLGIFDGAIDFNPFYDQLDIFTSGSELGIGAYLNKLNKDVSYGWTLAILAGNDGYSENIENQDLFIKDFLIDNDENIFIFGYYRGSVKFYNKQLINGELKYKEITDNNTSILKMNSSRRDYDIFIVKFDKDRNFVKKYLIGNDEEIKKDEKAHSIFLEQIKDLQGKITSENIYFTGSFEGDLTFERYQATERYCGILNTIDFDGNQSVNKHQIHGGNDQGYETNIGICNYLEDLNSNENEYKRLTNCYSGNSFCSGPPKTANFISKLDTNLNYNWSKVLTNHYTNFCFKAEKSSLFVTEGNIFLNTNYEFDSDAFVINPENNSENIYCESVSSINKNFSYLSILSTDGLYLYAWKIFEKNATKIISEIKTFEEHIYAINSFKGGINFGDIHSENDYIRSSCVNNLNPSTDCIENDYVYSLAITKLTVLDYIATKVIRSTQDVIYKDIISDSIGNLYIVGLFKGDTVFNSAAIDEIKQTNGGSDIFVLKLDKMLNFKWVETIGGLGDDSAESCSLSDDEQYIYIYGNYDSDFIKFKSGDLFDYYERDSENNYGNDIFLWKLKNE